MHQRTDRIAYIMAFDIQVEEHWLERDLAQWVHYEGLIRRPIVPWRNALTTDLHLSPCKIRGIHNQYKCVNEKKITYQMCSKLVCECLALQVPSYNHPHTTMDLPPGCYAGQIQFLSPSIFAFCYQWRSTVSCFSRTSDGSCRSGITPQ